MIAPRQEIFSVLRQYNPWWDSGAVRDLPEWRRAAFSELILWLAEPPVSRAILLSGARQVGKTTLLLQAVQELLARGAQPERILYATFDHPLLKLIGLEGVLAVWREIQPRSEETEYLLLDEIQYTQHWQTWLKHQVDFEKRTRIAVTGSAVPLETENLESGVGRWHTIRLATLSFSEYLQIQEIQLPNLPEVDSLAEVLSWSVADRLRAGESARPLVAHFHEYLLLIPFEVKYSRSPVQESDLKGLRILCEEKEIPRGYVITREISDFDVMTFPGKVEAAILKIPAPLACYWCEHENHDWQFGGTCSADQPAKCSAWAQGCLAG